MNNDIDSTVATIGDAPEIESAAKAARDLLATLDTARAGIQFAEIMHRKHILAGKMSARMVEGHHFYELVRCTSATRPAQWMPTMVTAASHLEPAGSTWHSDTSRTPEFTYESHGVWELAAAWKSPEHGSCAVFIEAPTGWDET